MAAKLLTHGTIVTYDETSRSVKTSHDTSILIIDGRIHSIGQHLTPSDVVTEVIDMTGKIVAPGFINTHTHMWQTAFRSINPNATLAEYFTSYSQHSESIQAFTDEDIYVSTLQGYLDGLNGGVTSHVEHSHCSWGKGAVKSSYKAALDSGARVWWCHAIDHRGMSFDEQWEYIASLGRRSDCNHPLISLGLAYDDLGHSGPEQLQTIKELVRKHHLEMMTIHHLGEEQWGIGTGSPSVAAKHNLQDLDIPLVFSHGGFVTQQDRESLRMNDWNLSITPESEMAFGHGQWSSKLALQHGSLGIDTNWQFSGDILTQARLWMQHVRTNSYTSTLRAGMIPSQTPMTVESSFILATYQGARAVRRNDIGVLKPGAKADLIVLDGSSVNMIGWTNAVAAVMLHANVSDIQHVLVEGEFRKRDGKLILQTGEEWSEFGRRFAEVSRRIQKEHPGVAPMGENFMGVKPFGDVESFVVV